MSIISTIRTDDSPAMARRLAKMTLRYLDDPKSIDKDILGVPLENLFRLSEMFRQSTYADEPRMGVVAVGDAAASPLDFLQGEDDWSTPIDHALELAFRTAYGDRSDEEVRTFQLTLRDIALSKQLAPDSDRRLRSFLETFGSNLA
jgi:hypothetical protein